MSLLDTDTDTRLELRARSARRIRSPDPIRHTTDQPNQPQRSTQLDQRPELLTEQAVLVPRELERGLVNNSLVSEETTVEEPKSAARLQRGKGETRFWLLNKWQGQVLSVGEETFDAQLFDMAHPNVTERAEFLISDLPEDGRALLRPGAMFYWMIGYRDEGTRQRTRASVIWMKRSGRLDPQKYEAILENVNKTWGAFEDTSEPTASHR